MTESEITVFGLRAGGRYVLAAGVHKVQLSPNSYTDKYLAHWTGTQWEEHGKCNAQVFDYRKYAEEYLEENQQLLLAELRKWNRP